MVRRPRFWNHRLLRPPGTPSWSRTAEVPPLGGARRARAAAARRRARWLTCRPGGADIPRILDLTCLALALAGAALAAWARSAGEGGAVVLLVVALCAAPVLVRAAQRVPAGRSWAPVTVLGAGLAVAGLAGTADGEVLRLADPGTSARQVAADAAGATAPLAWAVVGGALVLAGLALRTADRVLGMLAACLGVLVSGAVAAALLARSVATSSYSVLGVEQPPAACAAAVALAGVLLVVVAARWRSRGADAPPAHRASAAPVRWVALAVVVALVGAAGVWAWSWFGATTEPARVIADDALAACVAAAAGRPGATDGVSDRDLSAVDQLSCDGADSAVGPIRSLEGIQRLPNLTSLYAPRNDISDLAPLASLPRLSALTLTDNAVSDLSPLAGLPLFDLGLSQNPVADLSPLAGTTTLSALGVASAQLTDISALSGLDALSTLDLSGNAITDVSPLAGLPRLDTVDLSRNQVVDPSPLGTIPTLLVLDLFLNQVTEVGGLADAPLLQQLQLGANPLTDLRPLLRTTSLLNLGLDESDSTRLTGIDELRAAGVSVNGLA
jgi:Leucine Rich repeats (2 copies)